MRFASYVFDGEEFYGAITNDGAINLKTHFRDCPTLFDVVARGGFAELKAAAEAFHVSHRSYTFLPPLPNARRILCVGVNFPDRNAEYQAGSAQPKHM